MLKKNFNKFKKFIALYYNNFSLCLKIMKLFILMSLFKNYENE